jgi:undecaprenyl phosphate-alpha-L-ara4N flippase subunit ArnE
LPYVLLVVAIAFNMAGQVLLKRAAMSGSGTEAAAAVKAYLSPWFFGGVSSLGLSMLLWVNVLRKVPLTIAHPATAVVFVFVPILAHFLWGEPLPPLRLLGIGVIVLGVYLVFRGTT